MKKILLTTLSACLLAGCSADVSSIQPQSQEEGSAQTVSIKQDKTFDFLTLFSSKTNVENRAWVGTFQLVFNDMKNNIIKHDVKFIGEKPTSDLIGLNNEEFNSSMLNENSYYTSYGKTKPSEAEKIKRDIKKKFNETSDILDMGDWSEGEGKYYAYAMLKKEFEFKQEFDILDKSSFNNSEEQFEFFGIKDSSQDILDENVNLLFYNNQDDFAVQLLTKNNDIVVLYRTENNADFKSIYKKMLQNEHKFNAKRTFKDVDTLKVPNIKIDKMKMYPELCGKQIEGTDLAFSQAIETLKLELNNKGGKVKSEALLMTRNAMIMPEDEIEPLHLDFDKTFVMFLIDAGKEDPYLAIRVKDLKEFQQLEEVK